MDLGIAHRRAVVAASTSGLGRGAARALAADGARVVVSGRTAERVDAAVATLRGEGGDVEGVVADVSTPDGATAFVAAAAERLGGPADILVTNAGGPPPGTFATTALDAYLPALQLNLLSVVAMCHAAVPAMVEAGWGRVVAITSVSVRQPIDDLILSNTARAGATGFLKTLATEVARHGVTVNSVQPGLHATARLVSMHADLEATAASVPARRLGDPDDFGRVVAFLCSEAAGFLTGAAIPVDGGASRALQ